MERTASIRTGTSDEMWKHLDVPTSRMRRLIRDRMRHSMAGMEPVVQSHPRVWRANRDEVLPMGPHQTVFTLISGPKAVAYGASLRRSRKPLGWKP